MSMTRRACLTTAFALMLGCSSSHAAPAPERGSRDEAKSLCEAAAAHVKKVGVEQAVKDFGSDRSKWMPKDLFPFVQDMSGVIRFHLNEKMIGKSFLEVKDASGKEFAKDMVAAAKSGKPGWVDYEWAHPVTKKIEDKSAYILRVQGADLLVGVGFYR